MSRDTLSLHVVERDAAESDSGFRRIPGLAEIPQWSEPTRTIVLKSPDGVRRGRVEWIASDVTDEFLEKLEELLALTIAPRSEA
jgi:hypothetical protein